ncbi:hypothetical protein NQD34_001379 [Periophthalmus magnuspinnatus]|nr:hypothetical protein NQD34_001379 [Periophthalmus magnuspinnatus]
MYSSKSKSTMVKCTQVKVKSTMVKCTRVKVKSTMVKCTQVKVKSTMVKCTRVKVKSTMVKCTRVKYFSTCTLELNPPSLNLMGHNTGLPHLYGNVIDVSEMSHSAALNKLISVETSRRGQVTGQICGGYMFKNIVFSE